MAYPVNASFYPATGSDRVFAFNVQPDAALQSNIPFIRNQTGGNLSQSDRVSVLCGHVGDNPFASYNGTLTRGRQVRCKASLAINGQGASQARYW